jgi:hypothetical protein
VGGGGSTGLANEFVGPTQPPQGQIPFFLERR